MCTSQLILKLRIFNFATARSRNDVSFVEVFPLSAFFAFECFSFELFYAIVFREMKKKKESHLNKIQSELTSG